MPRNQSSWEKKQLPLGSFGTADRLAKGRYNTLAPGPGAYQPRRPQRRPHSQGCQRSIAFGTQSIRSASLPLERNYTVQSKDADQSYISRGRKRTIRSLSKALQASASSDRFDHAPNEWYQHNGHHKTKFHMGTTRRLNTMDTHNSGPGCYFRDDTHTSLGSHRSYSFGRQVRKSVSSEIEPNKNCKLGPGEYGILSVTQRGEKTIGNARGFLVPDMQAPEYRHDANLRRRKQDTNTYRATKRGPGTYSKVWDGPDKKTLRGDDLSWKHSTHNHVLARTMPRMSG